MPKVVITLSDKPSECSLIIDGEQIKNVTSVKAYISMEDGPEVSYFVAEDTVDEYKTVDFTPIFDDVV